MSTHMYTHSGPLRPHIMAAPCEQVTVDKAYFDALLRRADFHTRSLGIGHEDPASITISRAEYDGLHRRSREYELLKTSLFSGGITPETLALLISGGQAPPPQSNQKVGGWADDYDDNSCGNHQSFHNATSWKYGEDNAGLQPGNGAYLTNQSSLRVPSSQPSQRHVSYETGPSSIPADTAYDEAESYEGSHVFNINNNSGSSNQRTLYIANITPQTTYRDLLSVIKGGKILSINVRSEKSATVTFFDAAADFLTWTKRNDIYLHSKRLEIRWADRQFRLNKHIASKVNNGATRNLCIRGAASHGLSEQQIREDMEHIHGLLIVDITYRNGPGDAYVSTNSVHNALFARTCMMSRSTYKGCKIEFYPDECDVELPLPAPRSYRSKERELGGKAFETMNRFGMLELDSAGSSEEENRGPRGEDDEDDAEEFGFDSSQDYHNGYGVSLG